MSRILLSLIAVTAGSSLAAIVPAPQKQVALHGEPFQITKDTPIVVRDRAQGRELSGPELLNETIKAKLGFELPIIEAAKHEAGRHAIIVGEWDKNPALHIAYVNSVFALPQRDQSYVLRIEPDAIRVIGHDPAGSFYGCITLRQLIEGDGKVAAMMIEDYPDLPLRGTYGIGGPLEERIKYFASLKLNLITWENGDYYKLDDPKAVERQKRFFALCEKYFIEPVPLLQSWGHGHYIVSRDPLTAEGETNEEEITLAEEFVELGKRNVIDLPNCPILVTSLDGATSYERDKDFEIERGEFAGTYKETLAPWRIRPKVGGALKAGHEVKLTYSYLAGRARTYCPSEPRTQAIMKKALQQTVNILHPRFIHIGHDEPGRINRDLRCTLRGLSDVEIIADELNRMDAYIKEADRSVRIMMWPDSLNPKRGGREGVADLIPKDIIMCTWFYAADEPTRDRAIASLAYFADHGFEVTGSPWFNPLNAYHWCEDLIAERKRSGKALGILYTSWRDGQKGDVPWAALEVAMEHSWSFGKPKPLWLAALNQYFASSLSAPTVAEMQAVMARRLDAVTIRNAPFDEEWQRFVKLLAELVKGGTDVQTRAEADRVRGAYRMLAAWVEGEEAACGGNQRTARSRLRELVRIGKRLNGPDWAAKFQHLAGEYATHGKFPDAEGLFGIELARRRPGQFITDEVLEVPITRTATVGDHRLNIDLLAHRDGLVRLDFEAPGYAEVTVMSNGEEGVRTLATCAAEGEIVRGPAIFDPPASGRHLVLVGIPAEGKTPAEIAGLRLYKTKARRDFTCPVAEGEPVIDGKLDDPAWAAARLCADFVTNTTNELIEVPTFARIMRFGGSLYIAFECFEDPGLIGSLVMEHTERDSKVYSDDCVEVFIDANNDETTYAHFLTNPLAAQYDERRQNRASEWDAHWDCAANIGLDRWTVEMRIPLSSLGMTGFEGTWGINFNRARRTAGVQEICYSVTFGSFHNPKRFAKMRFD